MKTFSLAPAVELVLLGKILEASPVSAGIMVPMPELEAEMTHNHILSFWGWHRVYGFRSHMVG